MADLQTLVDFGPRVAGSAAEQATIAMIKERMESYGYDVVEQEFELPALMEGTVTIAGVTYDNTRIAGGPGGAITGTLVEAGLGKQGDFANAEGNIALIQRGDIPFQEKVDNAVAAGAAGVIIYNNAPGGVNFSVQSDVPVVGVSNEDGLGMLANAGQEAQLDIAVLATQSSSNVIATKLPADGSTDADIIHVSAHIDSVPGSPGANDNGSGTAAAIEIARVLQDADLDKEIRFSFVGAEEIGLLGSKFFVDSLTDEEVARSIANFNMDMVATAWEPATAMYTNTLDGQHNLVTTTANTVAEMLGTPSQLVLLERGASDHVNFHDAGIDAANFIRREPGTANLEPYYHTPNDTMEHISQERLGEAIDLIGGSVYYLARQQ